MPSNSWSESLPASWSHVDISGTHSVASSLIEVLSLYERPCQWTSLSAFLLTSHQQLFPCLDVYAVLLRLLSLYEERLVILAGVKMPPCLLDCSSLSMAQKRRPSPSWRTGGRFKFAASQTRCLEMQDMTEWSKALPIFQQFCNLNRPFTNPPSSEIVQIANNPQIQRDGPH